MARWSESEIGYCCVPGRRWRRRRVPRGAVRPAGDGHRDRLPGSVAGSAALTIDWLLCYLIAGLFSGPDALASPNFSWLVMAVWFVLTAVAVAAFGITPGMAALGMRVASLRSTLVGVPRAVLRTALVALVLPALARDGDGRGWHDRAASTIVVRTRG